MESDFFLKKIFILLVLFSLIFLTACTSDSKKWMRDKRFDFELNLGDNDLTLVFTKTPNFNATVTSVNIDFYKKNEYGEVEPWTSKECSIVNGSTRIVKDNVMHFNCSLKDVESEKNIDHYEVKFKISHTSPLSYKPVNGETCLKYSSKWDCSTGGGITS